jgi:hypothetical protein
MNRASQEGNAGHGGVVALAVAVLVAGCGSGSAADDGRPGPDGGGTPQRPAASAAGQAGSRADLAVVALTARIGDEVVESSGTVLDADRGLVLTTAHSLWGATSLKVTTGLALLHGRIVARNPCDDMALVETQPRLPGLVAAPRRAAGAMAGGATGGNDDDTSVVVASRGDGRVVRTSVELGAAGGSASPAPIARSAIPLRGALPAKATGSPVLDTDGRLLGMVEIARASGRTQAAMLRVRTIDARMRELQPGDGPVYVGWRRHYACTGRLDAHARAQHSGYRARDARLNRPVRISRLPGSRVAGDG